MRPTTPGGSPLVRRFQVRPASVDLKSPLRGPPPTNPNGMRRRGCVAGDSTAYPFPGRIFAGPGFAGERLAHDDDGYRAITIFPSDQPSRNERHTQCFEIPGCHEPMRRDWNARRVHRRAAFDNVGGVERQVLERNIRRHSRRLDVRRHSHVLENRIHEPDFGLTVRVRRR